MAGRSQLQAWIEQARAQRPVSGWITDRILPLGSLDAIHLAAARSLGQDLIAVVTYDSRMAVAAAALGLDVASPS